MRFAYIDSQGNEVSIPSVDALALRIELGAIGPDTQLYDAQADHWGPAETHEIFHTLSRDVAGEGGFVAPPPPVTPEEPEAEAPVFQEDDATGEPEVPPAESEAAVEAPEARPDMFGFEPEPPADEAPDEAGDEEPVFDFSQPLALADDEPEAEPEAPVAAPSFGGDDLGLDLTLADGLDPTPSPEVIAGGDEAAEEEDVSFDFGGGLELAPEPFEAPEPAVETEADSAMDFGSGGGFLGGMELEQPMSEFTSDSPPSWMEQSPPSDDDVLEMGPGDAEFATPEPETPSDDDDLLGAPRERPEPRNRPSPPRRPRKKSLPTGAILGVVAVLVVGGGGYFGWQAFQGREAPDDGRTAVPVLPPVTIPDIPAELLPVMRDLGEASLNGMIAQLRDMQADFQMPAEPNGDWLAGVYLANASQFRDVQAFWEGIERYVDRVRDIDTQVFHDRYVAELEAAAIGGDTAAMLLERADSGFLATRQDRFEAYAQMDDLINAALGLHTFLLNNEDNIEFDPAAGGISRDPVLEAVPATRELGEEMWGMVDQITGALDALGTLDKVTTERLTAVLYDRIRRAGFQ